MQLIIALYIQDRRFVILNSPKEVPIPRSRTQHINISDARLYTVCHWKSLIDVSDAWTSEWRPRIIFPNILTSILTIKWPASQMLLPRNQSPFRKKFIAAPPFWLYLLMMTSKFQNHFCKLRIWFCPIKPTFLEILENYLCRCKFLCLLWIWNNGLVSWTVSGWAGRP